MPGRIVTLAAEKKYLQKNTIQEITMILMAMVTQRNKTKNIQKFTEGLFFFSFFFFFFLRERERERERERGRERERERKREIMD